MSCIPCLRVSFLIVNSVYLLVGVGVIGYVAWNIATLPDTTKLLSGSYIFTYFLLGAGILVTIIGVFGCIGGCAQSTCVLKVFVGFMVALILIDIAVIVTGYVKKSEIFVVMDSVWSEMNQDTKDQIQKELKCCGYTSSTEYTSPPESCLQNPSDANSIYSAKCKDEMIGWLDSNIPIWASVLSVIMFVQITSSIVGCCLLTRLRKFRRVSEGGRGEADSDDEGDEDNDEEMNGHPNNVDMRRISTIKVKPHRDDSESGV